MGFETILTRREGPCLVVTLNRPARRNAINLAMMDEVVAAARQADNEPSVRALVLTGAGDCFSAGADLNDALAVKSPSDCLNYFSRLHRMGITLEELGKPVIAAIEGFCMTGGCELALACDIRVAAEGATFAITSARIGTVPGAGGTQRLPRAVGEARALELMFSAEPVGAAEAYRIGLVNRLAPKGGALAQACALGAAYEERAPLSHALIKRAVRRGMRMDLAAALEFEISLATAIYGTDDKREGISAFLEKRAPSFKGR